MSENSIFFRIDNCILKFGELPEGFEAEEKEYKDNELRFAPGALEGIFGHHMSEETKENSFAEKIKEYLAMEPVQALQIFEEEEAETFKTASVRNGLRQSIYSNREEYDSAKVYKLACCFTTYGTRTETVKLGLSLLSLFDLSENQTICNVLKTLGYCEDFTDYVIMNTASWQEEKKQDLYFELAKKLKGWGKINVVEMMQADTKEKKDWILCHGCRNSVMYAYLGYECAMKCDLFERLQKGNFSDEEFRGASDIMDGLLDEGPCQGMSALEKPVELTLLYLEECRKHTWDSDIVSLITDIAAYFKDSKIENAALIMPKVKEVLEPLDMNTFIVENIENDTHNCIRIAKMYDIDMSEHLIRLMKMDFKKYYTFCFYLFKAEKYVDDFFALCEREVSEEAYPNEMGDSLGLGPVQGDIRLDMIVQHLEKYPLKGKKMIKICIQSPITRWRNMAAKAMLGWVKETGRALKDIDAELYGEVVRVHKIECNEQTKGMWEKLL